MKEIIVISGKGGTGKTSIVASFAALAANAVLADCDVDAADLHLVLQPHIEQTHDFSGGKLASVITAKCIGCGKCEEVCNFDAAVLAGPANDVVGKTYVVDSIACEGCGVCTWFCPVDAIEFSDAVNGQWFISQTRFGPMVHARLGIAQENSGKLVSLIRKQAARQAGEQHKDIIIVDGAPGIGCPVIASITGADLVLIVTEPTVSAKHDLNRVLELTTHFRIPAAVCINKYDLNPTIARTIEQHAQRKDLNVVGRINYDNVVTEAQVAGTSVLEYADGQLKKQIVSLWEAVLDMLKEVQSALEDQNKMRIAIPVTNGRLSAHFGHCEQFAIIDADPHSKHLTDPELLTPPAHEPGILPKWLSGLCVDLVIAGGMGQRAQQLFAQNNIDVVVGAADNPPEKLALQYLTGRLQCGRNVRDH